jgi:hypothetical protein
LIKLLSVAEEGTQIRALEVIGFLGNEEAFAPVLELFLNSKESVKASAAKCLGKLQDRRAVEPLLDFVDSEDAEIRKAITLTFNLYNLFPSYFWQLGAWMARPCHHQSASREYLSTSVQKEGLLYIHIAHV